jgi:phage shock protein A
MGVLSRINDIIRSNLNDLVSKAENPEKLLNQAILDMENHLRKARKQVLDTIASEKTMEKKRLSVLETAARWERRAALALRSGDEELARQAILRKNTEESHAATLEEQIRVQREYVGALKQSLVALEERHQEARTKKEALIARSKAAKARKKTAERLGPEKSGKLPAEARAFDTFERMEDKVLALEAQAEAYIELSGPNNIEKDDAALDARFAAMENEKDIEEQLEKLKQQIGGKPAAGKS